MTPRPFRDEAHRDAALLKWLRREVNGDLRYWRSEPGALPHYRYHALVADCKAKLGMIGWAESWQGVHTEEYAGRPDVKATMISHLKMVMVGIKCVAAGYRDRDGWRPEWDLR